MNNFDRKIFGLLFGSAFPFIIGLLLATLWFFIDKNESRVLIYICAGILLGLLIDFRFLKKWVNKRYELGLWFLIVLYLIYNIGMFGFFMGFPVFNVFLGLIAGYYFGKRICFRNIRPELHKKIINRVSLFTVLIMSLICITSGIIALTEEGIGKDIQGMLGLSFEVTKEMILSLVVVGGLGLIVTQYFITRLTIQKIIRLNYKAVWPAGSA